MAQQNLTVRSGNRLIITFDGKQIGMLGSCRMSDDYAPDAASGIGDIHVFEWVPTQARHSLNVSGMMMIKGSMLQAGIAMENGDAVLQGLVFDIESYDKDTGILLRKYMGCSYASGEIDIQKHAIVVQSGVFNALDVSGLAS